MYHLIIHAEGFSAIHSSSAAEGPISPVSSPSLEFVAQISQIPEPTISSSDPAVSMVWFPFDMTERRWNVDKWSVTSKMANNIQEPLEFISSRKPKKSDEILSEKKFKRSPNGLFNQKRQKHKSDSNHHDSLDVKSSLESSYSRVPVLVTNFTSVKHLWPRIVPSSWQYP